MKKIKKDILGLVLVLGAVVLVNHLASTWFYRIDLTAEKRYTLSDNTRQFLQSMDASMTVDVFLEGDLNPGFRKLAASVREMLDEMKVFAGLRVRYAFINPNEGSNDEKKKLFERLQAFGCQPVPVYEAAEDGRNTTVTMFPYAIIHHNKDAVAVDLLSNIPGLSGAENLNKSQEELEYKLTDAMRKLLQSEKPRIAFLEGHGELDELDVMDVTRQLSEFYQVDRGRIGDDPAILDPYKVIIVAKPQQPFPEKDKYALDQYLMRGGRVLWMVDAVNVTLDSLTRITQTVGIYSDVNLNDMLFKYGIRINHDLIEDIQSAMIPINASVPGTQPKFVPVPWLFNPLLQPVNAHPVSRNINAVKGEFVSTIDTVGEDLKVKRHLLLHTSRFTKVTPVPVFVSLAMVNEQPVREQFQRSLVPVAYAQEGVFPSLYAHRPVPAGLRQSNITRLDQSVPTRMVVVADGDVAKNAVRYRYSNPQIVPLGFDELSGQTFGNKQFVVNAVNYLADDDGWMALRSRSYALRLLDKERLGREATFWKMLNVALPVVLVVLAGVGFVWLRRRKYGR
ncbi:MAG: gliding motility-associated ABC transporter substrate-binding protein GldG [Marinilabiliaceae bacterium]|nr:gliding motility-associated ABC transporter substrate-binding protein GldG [Marinilabiliaceae bacterium]